MNSGQYSTAARHCTMRAYERVYRPVPAEGNGFWLCAWDVMYWKGPGKDDERYGYGWDW